MQDQDLADEIVGGLRTGNQNWQAEADRQYSQEYGLGGFEYGPGQTDLDIRRRIQDQQGFIRTQQGMVPMGRSPTPEQIENYRNFHGKWANETPGTERQARYNPEAYEEFREGVRNDIRDGAQENMATYGTGPDTPLRRAGAGLAPLSDEQVGNRLARELSEDRVADAEREVRIARLARQAGISRAQARAMMDKERAGMLPEGAPPTPLNVAQRRQETQGLRDMAGTRRDAELAARQEALRSQRMLLAPGGRGMVNAINELPDEWRNIAILDRITQGRVGGPTPIARDALTLQNMQRLMNSDVMAGNDPFRQQMMRDQQQLREAQLPAKDRMALSRARGEPMGAGLSAGAVQSAWNSAWSEGDFIEQMEGAGYQLPEIQAWIDRKRNGGAAGPRPRADAPPPPGEGGPSTLDFAPGAGDMSF
jgi:DNA-binding transcriptional MerR regulator